MATISITTLATIRDNLLLVLVDLSENPKPNYSVKGRSVSWGDYHAMLLGQIKDLEDMIALQQPFLINTRQVL